MHYFRNTKHLTMEDFLKTKAFQQKLTAARDFAAVALFTGASIFYYHASAPEPTAQANTNPAANHAFVDANPIRLHWLTAAFKQDQDTIAQTPAQKSAFLDGKPIRLAR